MPFSFGVWWFCLLFSQPSWSCNGCSFDLVPVLIDLNVGAFCLQLLHAFELSFMDMGM